ncbi:DUF7935 family protein [Cesiribacter andamanensis]|uniref:Uncharacterized protein n=1 Tax=Cesiribacter andamanensis AMV16 TaxID=1279009 RepID=M7N486_9BACT|nr:hypothetical protein [Cesiribacter andamanensis]EMR02102.1 hypothetical protein ADICEAN_02764 [Cesiribacter andamanensis AMV16]
MELVADLLKIVIPAALVLYGMFLLVKSFLDKEFQQKALEVKGRDREVLLPIRLQAFERMVLFLERITPNNMLLRLNDSRYSAREFQQVLVHEVREEYNHNLSQQVYMSDESWGAVRTAMEEVIALINQTAEELPEEARSLDLSRSVLQKAIDRQQDPTGRALHRLKQEIRTIF